MRFKETKGCRDCVYKGRQIWGDGPEKPVMAIYAEAPIADDYQQRKPFSGLMGTYLFSLLSQAGIRGDKVYLSYTRVCSDTGERDGDKVQGTLNCKGRLNAELLMLQKKGVDVIVLLGDGPLNLFFDVHGVEKYRGSVFFKNGMKFVISYPLKEIFWNVYKREINIQKSELIAMDFKKAIGLRGYKELPKKYEVFPTFEKMRAFFEKAKQVALKGKSGKPLLSLDIEATGLNPFYAKLMCIGFALSETEGLCVPFLGYQQQRYWSAVEEKMVKEYLLKEVFPVFNFMTQNGAYDFTVLLRRGFPVEYESIEEDIMLLHHCIAPELSHRLGFISSVYGRRAYWKDTLLESGGQFTIPDREFREYNLDDCTILYEMLPKMKDDLRALNNEGTYKTEMGLLPAVCEMTNNGLGLDEKALGRLKKTWGGEVKALRERMVKEFKIPMCFKFTSSFHVRWLLFGTPLSGFKDLDKNLAGFIPHKERRLKCDKCKKIFWVKAKEVGETCPKCGEIWTPIEKDAREKAARKGGTKAHASLLEMEELSKMEPFLRDLKVSHRLTDGGDIQISSDARISIQRALNTRYEILGKLVRPTEVHFREKKGIENILAFFEVFNQFQKKAKLYSTFTKYQTGPDGKVHPGFMIHGTATGRLSCSKPNLQNIPKKEKIARSVFIPSKGKVFISADYTNLEVFILAYTIGDEGLIKFLEGGGNIHDQNTKFLFSCDETHPMWSLYRRGAKIFQFGGIQYGGSDEEIFKKILNDVPSFPLVLAQYKAAKALWMKKNPAYATWAEGARAKARDERLVETFSGRKRTLFGRKADIEKQGLNTPIQGGAADVINPATIEVYKTLKGEKDINLVLQIHDQLVLECYPRELEKAKGILKKHMEKPIVINGRRAQFRVDPEVGWNLADLKDYDEFIKEM